VPFLVTGERLLERYLDRRGQPRLVRTVRIETEGEGALAARATERLRLGPAVTNPVTRHPAVTAAAVATLQVESEGREAR
jgi:hypothetical protein